MPDAFDPASDFDHLFDDVIPFTIGDLAGREMLSPGHTLWVDFYVGWGRMPPLCT